MINSMIVLQYQSALQIQPPQSTMGEQRAPEPRILSSTQINFSRIPQQKRKKKKERKGIN